jgi:hypothetical protein
MIIDFVKFEDCKLQLQLSKWKSSKLPIILSLLLVLFLIIVPGSIFIYTYYYRSSLHSLPDAVSWSLFQHKFFRWRWTYEKSSFNMNGFYFTRYKDSSDEWNRVMLLFNNYLGKNIVKVIVLVLYCKLPSSFSIL